MKFTIFSKKMQELIKEKGFAEPTLAQKMGIPEIMKGSDVLIIAPTGIGKTETAMLGLFDKIHQEKTKPISILYLTPMRSLNRDLLSRLHWWAKKLDLEISIRHGDTTQTERTSQRECPPNILISTPESLQALLVGKRMREHMKNVRHVVIDEIHELVPSKRGIQLAVALERLQELTGPLQRIGLSATIGNPEMVAKFLGKATKIIRADAEKKYNIKIENPKPNTNDIQLSEELFTKPNTIARLKKLHELILSHKSVLIFSNTRETAEILSSRMRRIDKELRQEVHHGSLSKEKRITSEQKFKTEELKSLIATSSLELGIDIGSIDLVIQYLSPRQVSRIVQRVGRSGHGVGLTSKGIIISGEEDLFESSAIAKNAREKKIEQIHIHDSALDVLATQVIGLCMEYYDITDDKIYQIIKRAYPFRELKRKEFDEVIRFLELLRIIWINESTTGLIISKRKKAWEYYFENMSMIPDSKSYRVVSIIQGEPIGTLDAEFISEHGKPGEKFVVSGRAWKIIQIDGDKVIVEPTDDIESAIPAWEGELIPVPFDIAQEVGRIRKELSKIKNEDEEKKIKEKYQLDKNSIKEMMEIIEKQTKKSILPTDDTFLVESYKDFVIIHSCCGSLINDTIGRYLAAMITAKTGVAVNLKIDPYRIMIQTTATLDDIVKELKEIDDMKKVLEIALERSSLFKHRFMQVAKRFGIVSRRTQFERIGVGKIISQYENSPVFKETLKEIFVNKMDITGANRVMKMIKNGDIKLKIKTGGDVSYLGELGLIHQFSEVMKPKIPNQEIFNAFKKRLLCTRVRLLCIHCADYNLVKEVRDIEEQPECPKCGSRLIGIAHKNQDITRILKKRIKKKELTPEELREFENLTRSADLVMVYGKKCIMVLAGRGIGPETAARILSHLHPDQEKLLRDVLEAEKTFARTSVYWK
ncbi:MAG: DEAD/DEAH box helicase [Candidatus Aenigmatarchaeota archaeon]